MDKSELSTLQSWLAGEVERRRKLGLYSQEAGPILNLFETVYKIACHIKPDRPKKKK